MPFFPNEVRKARSRQPAGAPGGKGGEFAPSGGAGGGGAPAGKPVGAATGPVTGEERNRLSGLRASVMAASRHHFDAQSAHSAALRAQQRVRGNGKRAQAAAELVERTRRSAELAEQHYRGVEGSLKELASSLRARQPDFED